MLTASLRGQLITLVPLVPLWLLAAVLLIGAFVGQLLRWPMLELNGITSLG